MFKENKYTNWYFTIISNAKKKTYHEYTEQHHIIPKSLGGRNTNDNIVRLSAREHFICHWLLTKMVTGEHQKSMRYALRMMRKTNKHTQRYETKITSRVFEKNRTVCNVLLQGRVVSAQTRQRMSDARKTRVITDETCEKLSKPRKKRGPMSEEIKKKIAESNKGKVRTAETRQRMSQSAQGKPKSNEHKNNMSLAHQNKRLPK